MIGYLTKKQPKRQQNFLDQLWFPFHSPYLHRIWIHVGREHHGGVKMRQGPPCFLWMGTSESQRELRKNKTPKMPTSTVGTSFLNYPTAGDQALKRTMKYILYSKKIMFM